MTIDPTAALRFLAEKLTRRLFLARVAWISSRPILPWVIVMMSRRATPSPKRGVLLSVQETSPLWGRRPWCWRRAPRTDSRSTSRWGVYSGSAHVTGTDHRRGMCSRRAGCLLHGNKSRWWGGASSSHFMKRTALKKKRGPLCIFYFFTALFHFVAAVKPVEAFLTAHISSVLRAASFEDL